MTKLAYRAFGSILVLNSKPSLLYSPNSVISSPLIFYINDFFESFENFKNQFRFLRDYFLLRVKWIKLLLSFKKLRLFALDIKALKVLYKIEDHVHILKERVTKVTR